jgi:ABC-2 type transport system ATP-binding protein
MTRGNAVVADGVRKRYGDAEALAGFDLAVPAGTVCGLLGPNGAGKTTAVRILTTLLRFDGGRAEVAGCDVVSQPAEVRRRIGLVGQHPAVDEVLSGERNLVLFGRLLRLSPARARARAEELLDRFGLTEARRTPVRHYSGGMRRRLDLAASLIMAPQVLFLDEPTTGLDPRGRNEVWAAIRSLVGAGTTVLLTTQHLDEADQLADQIAVLAAPPGAGGRVIATGTPDQLKSALGGDRIDVVLHAAADLTPAAALVGRLAGAAVEVEPDTRRLSAPVRDRVHALTAVVRGLHDAGITAADVALRRPTLDEVFLHLTGHRSADQPAAQPGAGVADVGGPPAGWPPAGVQGDRGTGVAG